MKLTDEVFENCKWVDDYVVRYNYKGQNRKYKVTKCKYCGGLCLILDLDNGCFCSCYCSSKNRTSEEEWKMSQRKRLTGKKLPKATRDKMSITRTGHEVTQETRLKISISHIGVPKGPPSEETRKKLSIAGSGEKCNFWKGGVSTLKILLFETYAPQLEQYEDIRDNDGILEVKCAYCGKWFMPTKVEVTNRIISINNINAGERRLYCSIDCKQECPSYHRSKYYKGQKGFSSREVQPELRQLVFLRDGYECQKCGSVESLHCHHITGVELNPIESADVDNSITLCKFCHKEVHTDKGCRYYDLRGCKEGNQTMVVI